MRNTTQSKFLIVEGGGFKTGFTTGVLDAFLGGQYNPFNSYIGISGGSVSVSYYMSGQYRFCLNAILLLAQDENFMNYRRTFGEEGYMDIDFIADVAKKKVKFDIRKAFDLTIKNPAYFVATDYKTGKAAYLQPNKKNWIDCIIASSALPFVTKGKHEIEGSAFFDGGWSDPLPVKWAYEQGAKEIVILRTWPKGVRSAQSWSDYFGSLYYNSDPHLKQVFEKCHQSYNDGLEFIENPPKDLTIHEIAPAKLLKSTTYTYSKKSIMSDYRYGLDVGLRFVNTQRNLTA